MRLIAHISDLHFGRTDPRVVEGLVAELNDDPPHLVIASGDFTMRARISEYLAARNFLGQLVSPWLAVPGNHDISLYRLFQRFFHPFARYRRFIAPVTEPTYLDDEIAVIGLNTARRWAPELDWSHGRISRSQIARTEARLAALPQDRFRIVVAHHPFLPPPWEPETRMVGRAEDALALFARHDVRLVLAGHLHRGYIRVVEPVIRDGEVVGERPAAPGMATPPGLIVVQAGSATSTRLRNEANAYNRIVVEDGAATIEPRTWTGAGVAPLH